LDRRDFSVILLSRLALNMQQRVIYPFLPAISRGLGVPLETTSLLLTARAVANLSSPIYGILSDRFGRRALMLAGLAILVSGAFFVIAAPSFGLVLAAIAFLSLCKAVYDPAVLGYLGDSVPYERRGRVMGILAMMWPTSWLIGVPIAGFLIAGVGWRAPFAMIGSLGLLCLVWMLRRRSIGARRGAWHAPSPVPHAPSPVPHTPSHVPHAPSPVLEAGSEVTLRDWLRQTVSAIGRPAWFALSVTLLIVMASENVYIVYAAWMEKQFGLSVAVLGVISIVIALAEFTAEGNSAGWVDRVGKRRAVIIGLAVNTAAYLLLPGLANSLVAAIFGLFLVYLTYDFSIVSMLPLLTELAPGARGTLMALNVAALAVGRLLSSLTAVRLWNTGGLAANTAVSAGATLLALLILATMVNERQPVPQSQT
jgi:predicted MFS family arabinose efflux permease